MSRLRKRARRDDCSRNQEAVPDLCEHPAFYREMCVSCGQRAGEQETASSQNLIIGAAGRLAISEKEAERIQVGNADRLLRSRRLGLVLDIDHTLLHAVEGEVASPDTLAVTLDGTRTVIRLRPHLREFLEQAATMYELYLYTHGTRSYAELVAGILDPSGSVFRGRIVSRSDTEYTGEKLLSHIFLGDARMVVVMDDREDVWPGDQRRQLLTVRPYKFFANAVELNNESGSNAAVDSQAQDQQLLFSLEVLRTLHAQFYVLHATAADRVVPVWDILAGLRSQVLSGCLLVCDKSCARKVAASGVLELAVALGAQLAQSPSAAVTHALSNAKASPYPCSDSIVVGGVKVVSVHWIRSCGWAMKRLPEDSFLLDTLNGNALLSETVGFSSRPHRSEVKLSVVQDCSCESEDDSVIASIEAELDR